MHFIFKGDDMTVLGRMHNERIAAIEPDDVTVFRIERNEVIAASLPAANPEKGVEIVFTVNKIREPFHDHCEERLECMKSCVVTFGHLLFPRASSAVCPRAKWRTRTRRTAETACARTSRGNLVRHGFGHSRCLVSPPTLATT